MKTMNCNQLGGACGKEIYSNTVEEVSALRKQHGIEMHQNQLKSELLQLSRYKTECRS